MKKLFAILTCVLLLCASIPLGAIPVLAATSGTTGDCTWTLDGTHLTISGNGAMGDMGWWDWGTDITSVTIEHGVTTIGDYAFCECAALTSVTIPDSVTTISYSAFSCCSSLAEIVIPDSVTTIDDYAFDGCSSLTSVTIPDSVITIGDSAFYECSSLTSVTIGDGVTFIDDWAFYGCNSLTSVYITDVAAWCAIDFGSADANPIEYAHALYLDGVLITDLIIPDGVTSIGDYAFIGCNSLTEITIPDSVITIGDSAFYECSSLTSVTIDDGVTSIGHFSFSNCRSLSSITIPDSVTSIGKYAFNSCISLTDVFYSGGEAGRANITIDEGNTLLLNATWHYNYDCDHEYTGTITTPATCGTVGVMTYACSFCDNSYTEELPATGDHVYDNALDAACNVCGETRLLDGILVDDNFDDGSLGVWNSTCDISNDNGALKFNVTRDWGNIWTTVPVEPNTNYTIRFTAKSALGKKMWVKFNQGWSADIGTITIDSVSTAWTEYTYTLYSGNNTELVVLLQYAGYAADGETFWFDSIVIQQANRIINGGFETGDATGWETWQSTEITADAAHSGSYGAHLQGSGSWGSLLIQTIAVEAGKTYKLSFWINVNTTGCHVQVRDSAGNLLNTSNWFDSNTKDYTAEQIFTATDDTVLVIFCSSGTGSAESVYVDDIKLIEYEEGESDNLIKNGDFRYGSEDWQLWQGTEITAGAAHSGSYGAHLQGDGGWGGLLSRTISVKAGKEYKLSFWVKANSQGVNVAVKQNDMSGDNIEIAGNGWHYYWSEQFGEWTFVENTFVAPSDTLYLYFCGSGTGIAESVYVDDFTLVEVEGQNPVTNGNFETGTLAGWTNLWEACTVSFDELGRNGSKYALNFSANGQWRQVRQDNIPVQPNTDYVLIAYVKNPNNVNIVVKDGDDSANIVDFYIPNDISNRWIRHEIEFNSGEETAVSVLLITNSETGGSAVWDDVQLFKQGEVPCQYEGTTGDCTWTLDDDGHLTISGNGAMGDYDAPWGKDITSVTIEDGVTTIGSGAFSDCNSLTEITIPDSVTTIGRYAFDECDSLTSVYITDVAAWCAIDFGSADANPIEYAHALYLDGVLITDLIIPDGVTSIGDYAFRGYTSLISVTIPDSVTSIGDYAFFGCNSLTEITIPDSVISIGDYAFSGCNSLTSVTISNNITSIGEFTFAICTSLTEITIPANVTTISGCAFWNCGSLMSVTIGSGVTAIHRSAFDICLALTDVYYTGSEEDRANISIEYDGNDYLLNATWHYDDKPTCEHEYVGTITTPNTCGSAGVMTYTCSICGDSYTEELPPIGDHVYDNAFDDTCNVCGEKRPIDIPTDAPTFVVDDVTARAGDVFTVAVRTKNNSGIVSLKLKIGYDADVLELISVAAGDFPAEGYTFGPTAKNPFTVIWLDATQPNNTTDGNVVLLSFRVKEGAPVGQTDIVVSYNAEDVYDYDFNNVPFLIENGTVDIVDFRLGDINDDGYVNNKDLGILQRYLADLDVTVNLLAADVTADGHVNNKDLGRLQQYLADWDVELGK